MSVDHLSSGDLCNVVAFIYLPYNDDEIARSHIDTLSRRSFELFSLIAVLSMYIFRDVSLRCDLSSSIVMPVKTHSERHRSTKSRYFSKPLFIFSSNIRNTFAAVRWSQVIWIIYLHNNGDLQVMLQSFNNQDRENYPFGKMTNDPILCGQNYYSGKLCLFFFFLHRFLPADSWVAYVT